MKIICLIQQSIDSYKCNAMRTASELRTMNTNCTSISFPGSLHNLNIRSHLEPAPTGCPGLLDAAVGDPTQGDYDGRGQPTASPMLTAIMSGGVGISGRELYKYR